MPAHLHRLLLPLALVAGVALTALKGAGTSPTSPSPKPAVAVLSDWPAIDAETLRHFQALVRLDTSPPVNEAAAVDYLKAALDAEGIETKVFALDPRRPNLVARLRGNGARRPLLIMAHTDVVKVDPSKWKHPPFSATLEDGYIYGRGTIDDKDNVTVALMSLLLLKRSQLPLERDVVVLFEAGEETDTRVGIRYMVENHAAELDAEFCIAEGGSIVRTEGRIQYGSVQLTEKIPNRVRLVATGVAGHGSVPLRTNAVVYLANAITKISEWQTPMRLNDITRTFFERLATVSPPEDAARYRALLQGDETGAVQEYLAVNKPQLNSILRTSISPTMLTAGVGSVNVIPSEASVVLDIRALPDEQVPQFMEQLAKVIDNPAIKIERIGAENIRPGAPPSSRFNDAFKAIESAIRREYGVITLPTMSTGATDMAFIRAMGIPCYGVGPIIDFEDARKGYGAHSDQERISEEALYKFMRFKLDVVTELAVAKAAPAPAAAP